MKSKPKVLYGSYCNLAGLDKVRKYILDEELQEWYTTDQDRAMSKIGEFSTFGFSGFSSVNKDEVEIWHKGAATVMKMINRWSE